MPITKISYSCPFSKRLDVFLSENFPDYSRSYFKNLIKQSHVKVDGGACLASCKLKSGQEISVEFISQTSDIIPEKMDFKVVYEDSDILLIDKPSGVVVHPACAHPAGTLINGIMHYLGTKSKTLPRVGLVHRLDKETSGLLIVAKTDKAFKSLSKQFASRSVKKVYIALAHGNVRTGEGIIDKPVGRSRTDRKKMSVVSDGRASETYFRVLKRLKNDTLLEVVPKTGRTHQIRVHMSSIGHSIIGDKEYGPKTPGAERLMLHAYSLEITHPAKSKRAVFKADLPADFNRALLKFK